MAAKKRKGAARRSVRPPVKKVAGRKTKAPVRAAKARTRRSPQRNTSRTAATLTINDAIDQLFNTWHRAAEQSGRPVSAIEVARHKAFWKDALSRLESFFEPMSGLR